MLNNKITQVLGVETHTFWMHNKEKAFEVAIKIFVLKKCEQAISFKNHQVLITKKI